MIRLVILLFPLLAVAGASFSPNADPPGGGDDTTAPDPPALNSLDGPYVFSEGEESSKLRVIRVVNQRQNYFVLDSQEVRGDVPVSLQVHVDNEDKDEFPVLINPKIKREPASYMGVKKLLAISDIEGNFDAFYSLLVNNGVMDAKYNWTYGKSHLVLIGDFVDRGRNVVPCLWLIYRLEQEAEKYGGKVHYVLGNHERMNLSGDARYVDKKYIELAQILSGESDPSKALLFMMSERSHLANWMRSKNVMIRVGRYLFMHGGLSKTMLDLNLTIEEINSFARRSMEKCGCEGDAFPNLETQIIFGADGPLWYRGLVDYTAEEKSDRKSVLAQAKALYHVDHIVIGHTLVPEVSADFGGTVLRCDVRHPAVKGSGDSQGILIEDGKHFKVNDKGEKSQL